MKQKIQVFPLMVLMVYAGSSYGNVQPITPGEALYGIVSRIGVGSDEINSKIDGLAVAVNNVSGQDALIYDTVTEIDTKIDGLVGAVNSISAQDTLIFSTVNSLDTKVDALGVAINNLSVQDALIYDTVSQIDTELQNISGSNIEVVSSILDVINDKLVVASSVIDATVPQLQSVVDELSSTVDVFSSIANNLSAQDALIVDTVTQIDSKVDALGIAVNNLSEQDSLIYDTVTEIDTKVDALTVAVNNVSTKDALIYDTVTEIDTKVDALGIAVNNLSTQDTLIYSIVSQIDTQLQTLSGSNIETIASLFEVVTEKLIEAGSTIDNTLPQLQSVVDSFSSQVEGLSTVISGLSTMDALIYDTVTEIDTKVDVLTIAVNNVSAKDVLIYNTVTEIDSKIDALNTGGSLTTSIYDTVTEIDSKVDLLKGFPDFVQGPTNFTSVSIESNTSRYFYQSALLQPAGVAEVPILSIRNNSASTVVRISALGGGVVQNPSGIFGAVKFYKNATLTGASFTSVYPGQSIMVKDTTASAFSGGTAVFQVANVFSAAGGACELPLTFIPKESYSITIQPGETLTATVQGIGTSSVHQAVMLWEEIIVA